MTEIVVPSRLGPIGAEWHRPSHEVSRGAVLCVGGFDGGFDGPAEGIYGDLGEAMPELRIGVLRLDFRVKTSPGPIDDGTLDVLAGIDWLIEQGMERVALIGHSYGGAIVVRAAHRSEAVAGTCALSTQTMGIEPDEVKALAPRPLLLIHGGADWRLPPRLSEWVYSLAGEGRELHILDGATHSLRQRRDDLWVLLLDWIDRVLPVTGLER
ncbi:MAG: alpha/beta hydrolase [Chloroflexota bacterium]|nr:alpha/beta hydrolase [Chloroflexota bacterium]MDE2895942.1 alpha/beta hydrolase [Chloroflexota bacterium]